MQSTIIIDGIRREDDGLYECQVLGGKGRGGEGRGGEDDGLFE